MALTDLKLKSMNGKKHDGVPIKYADRDGLNAYHRKTGRISFVYRYRYNGKPQDLTLGHYPIMKLAKAREETLKCRAALAEGYDPKIQRQVVKLERCKAATVRGALEYWLENYAMKNRTNYDKHRAQFERHVYPRIGYLPIEQCDTTTWVKVFDDISKGTFHRSAPKAAGYILQNCKQALRFCRVRTFANSHALDDLTVTDIGERQGKKDRVLSWSELMDVWHWCRSIKSKWYYQNLTCLLIVFGCRTHELRLSKISEWDLEEGLWTVPKSHSKTKEKIVRPIPELLRPYIQSLIDQSSNSYLLGELRRPETVSAFGSSLSQKLNHSEHWTLHDLRRTFATMMNDMEIEPYVVEQLLGHALGGVMAIYNRSQHLNKKKAALNLWLIKLTNYKHIN